MKSPNLLNMKKIFRITLLVLISSSPNFSHGQNSCLNADFEASAATAITSNTQISGWLCSSNTHTNGSTNCDMATCCASSPQTSSLISAASGYTDAAIGSVYPIYSVFGSTNADANAATVNPQLNFAMKGNNFIRIGSSSATPARFERVSKTFTVTASNYVLDVAFIAVLTKGHACCDAAMFKVTINSFTCPLIFASGAGTSQCPDVNNGMTFYAALSGTLAGATTSQMFTKWDVRRIDLSAFVGQIVTINFTTSSCSIGGHYGYAYIDTQCGNATMAVNGNTVALASGVTSISACGGNATITAPPYFETYQWLGPQGFTSTAATIVTSVTGTYTLNLADSLSCNVASHTVIILPAPTISISTSKTISCAGSPVVLTASGVTNYTWQNGATNASISITPTTSSTYSLVGKAFGCSVTQSFTQNVVPCLGLSDSFLLDESINIFPNPNHNEFTLTLSSIEKGVLIIENTIGAKVFQKEITNGENHINTKGISTGIYYYIIMNGEKELKRGKLIFD